MRTAMLTFFTMVLLGTALAASALGAIGSPGGGTTLDLIPGSGAAERQVDGTAHAVTPVVLLPPTSGAVTPVVLLPPTSGAAPVAAPVRLPSTSTAPPSALFGLIVGAAGAASGLTLLVMAGRRRR